MDLFVHSFTFTPPKRFDVVPDPWVNVLIREAAPDSPDGPFTDLETIALSPVDTDPTQPAERQVSTDLATLPAG
jgi:hypothetical protein